VARVAHAIKDEAALLEVGVVELNAHQLEKTLAKLRGSRTLPGDELIPVAIGVNELLDRINRVDAVVSRVARFARQAPAGAASETDALAPVVVKAFEALGSKVANDLNKEIYFAADFPPLSSVPVELLRVCQEVLPQLVRNAVAQGIERDDERVRSGKKPCGHVRARFEIEGARGFRVSVRDDGSEVSLERLRRRAVDSGLCAQSARERMGDHQLVSMLFEPGFSTVAEEHLHVGRGDGLSVVREVLSSIGARLRLLSRANAVLCARCPIPARAALGHRLWRQRGTRRAQRGDVEAPCAKLMRIQAGYFPLPSNTLHSCPKKAVRSPAVSPARQAK